MRKVLLNFSAILLLMSFAAMDLNAQMQTPAPSPSSELKQTVGLTDVTIVYSRPGVKDRKIFAKDGLVPFGKPWRLGANAATKFSFSKDVMILGSEMKAGDYAVLATPGATEWKFMFYPYESGSWSSYLEKEPVATVSTKPQPWDRDVESMTFHIGNLKPGSADIALFWENTMVVLPLEVHTDKQVMASIESVMGGPSQGDYFAAATYYHESGKDLNQALQWVEKATAGDNPRFWQVRRKALILADMGKTKDAIEAAKVSMKLAQDAGNEDFVQMNKKSIEEWTK